VDALALKSDWVASKFILLVDLDSKRRVAAGSLEPRFPFLAWVKKICNGWALRHRPSPIKILKQIYAVFTPDT
jgi:hypothetical protein